MTFRIAIRYIIFGVRVEEYVGKEDLAVNHPPPRSYPKCPCSNIFCNLFSVYSADDDTEIIGYLIVSVEVSEFLRKLAQHS